MIISYFLGGQHKKEMKRHVEEQTDFQKEVITGAGPRGAGEGGVTSGGGVIRAIRQEREKD